MLFYPGSMRWHFASCRLIFTGPKCKSKLFPDEVRQQIVEFHDQLGNSLSYDCKLEKQARRAINKNGVDTSKIKGPINKHTEMSFEDISDDVGAALEFWLEKKGSDYNNMVDKKNKRVGCYYKTEQEEVGLIYHFVCAYVSYSVARPYSGAQRVRKKSLCLSRCREAIINAFICNKSSLESVDTLSISPSLSIHI
ncbi:hypothetical protein Y032_0636g935 [Ancylostoma ceylanicum]|uniref:SCP domain-containing protein n=1 Tax=Ancylostoma ceylanicum TaxID=53326 RepID=A0A016WJU2_9BILA|nr:hypothetical protein Y032_0636g935 [Ancylostoma ceylanicum]